MSPQLRIAQETEGWVVLNESAEKSSRVAINDQIHYEDRDELVQRVQERGLLVWTDGTISRDPEPEVVDSIPETKEEEPPEKPVRKRRESAKKSPEEQRKARAEYAKKYRQQMTA